MAENEFGNIRSKPTSASQAKRMYSNDRVKTLVKQQLQKYIENFFKGMNRDLLKAVSPKSLAYNIDRSFDPTLDPTQKRLQIARHFNHLRNILPAVLIADAGVEPIPQSIGYLSDAFLAGKEWQGIYPIMRRVNISIIAASMDVDTTDELGDLLSLMFNELTQLAGGHYITGDMNSGEAWVVTLPNEPVSIGARSETPINDDPLDRIHYVETTFTVMFEDKVRIAKEANYDVAFTSMLGDPDLRQTLTPKISIYDSLGNNLGDAMSLNQQAHVRIEYYNPTFRVYVSDANLATISQKGVITPRKPGQIDIIIDDTTRSTNRILAKKTITIT